MIIPSSSEQPNCCAHYFDTPIKKATLITSVALLGIALVVLGALGSVAYQNPHMWINLNNIGMAGSISALVAGALCLFTALALTILFYKRQPITTQTIETDQSQQPIVTNQSQPVIKPIKEKLVIPDLKDVYLLNKQAPSTSPYSYDALESYTHDEWKPFEVKAPKNETPEEGKKREKELAEKKQEIYASYREKLMHIYKDEKNIPFIYNNTFSRHREYRLILLSDEAFFDQTLETIVTFSSDGIQILAHRLSLLENEVAHNSVEPENVITLRDLRQLRTPSKMVEWVTATETACLFSAEKLSILLKEEEVMNHQLLIAMLLPLEDHVVNYTRHRLTKLASMEDVAPLLNKLPFSHIRLLPPSYFSSSDWSWTKKNFVEILNCGGEESKQIARTIPVPKIVELADVVTLDHLSLFSEKQLVDPKMPWNSFTKIDGFGIWLGERENLFVQIQDRIPWEDFVKKEEECRALFNITKNEVTESSKLRTKLHSLPIETISLLSPIWDPKHLVHFEMKQLTDQKFPWKSQATQTYIVDALNGIFSERDGINDINFPWADLEKKEVKNLFAGDLLKKVKVEIIAATAQHLSYKDINRMGEQPKNKKFPWKAFFKPGIGLWLQEFDNREWIPHVPMVELAKAYPDEFQEVIKIRGTDFNQTRIIKQFLRSMKNHLTELMKLTDNEGKSLFTDEHIDEINKIQSGK